MIFNKGSRGVVALLSLSLFVLQLLLIVLRMHTKLDSWLNVICNGVHAQPIYGQLYIDK